MWQCMPQKITTVYVYGARLLSLYTPQCGYGKSIRNHDGGLPKASHSYCT